MSDTLLLVAAVKGLAVTALTDIRHGLPAPRPQPEMLRAAYWRAARDGLRGKSINLCTGRLEPAAVHLDRLWDTALAALETPGDVALLRTAYSLLRADGNGAERQRAAHRRRHQLTDVVDYLIQNTTARATPRRPHPAPSDADG
ncbi:hypothetical protein AB0E78_23365 [Streptomyces sp. NPDC032198]|uniref:hypothetical protein n=1 Tax=Streptomyces sp. NPDC032198 TaxID=3155127 RepID=UPI0033EFA7E3